MTRPPTRVCFRTRYCSRSTGSGRGFSGAAGSSGRCGRCWLRRVSYARKIRRRRAWFQIRVRCRSSRRHPPDPAFGDGVHPGRPDVAQHGPDPAPARAAPNAAVKSGPRSRIMNLARCACSPRSISRFRACWVVHSPVGWSVTPRMRMRLLACWTTARTYAWVPSSRSAVKKSHARIASAWERRNSDQVGPVRRGAGSMPTFFRISHTVGAGTRTPSPASSPWILR